MHAKYICKPNIVKFLENNNDKNVEFSPARILIKTRIIKLSFSIKKYAIPIIRPRFLEVRYSRSNFFISPRIWSSGFTSLSNRIEPHRDARNVDTIPKVFVSGKLKAYSLRFLIQRSLRRIKVTAQYLLRIVATVSKQCQQSWFPPSFLCIVRRTSLGYLELWWILSVLRNERRPRQTSRRKWKHRCRLDGPLKRFWPTSTWINRVNKNVNRDSIQSFENDR